MKSRIENILKIRTSKIKKSLDEKKLEKFLLNLSPQEIELLSKKIIEDPKLDGKETDKIEQILQGKQGSDKTALNKKLQLIPLILQLLLSNPLAIQKYVSPLGNQTKIEQTNPENRNVIKKDFFIKVFTGIKNFFNNVKNVITTSKNKKEDLNFKKELTERIQSIKNLHTLLETISKEIKNPDEKKNLEKIVGMMSAWDFYKWINEDKSYTDVDLQKLYDNFQKEYLKLNEGLLKNENVQLGAMQELDNAFQDEDSKLKTEFVNKTAEMYKSFDKDPFFASHKITPSSSKI